jgi:hypothetical protein
MGEEFKKIIEIILNPNTVFVKKSNDVVFVDDGRKK